MPMSGRESILMSNLKPKKEMTHAVTVVPTLAPMITLMDCPRVSKPALTKLTTMTVVALEDWIRAVTSIPVRTPVMRFVVITERMLRSLSPATFWSPSLMIFMP